MTFPQLIMKNTIRKIIKTRLGEELRSLHKVTGLGSVNQVFEIKGSFGEYILRLNKAPEKRIEYRKEKWCLEQVLALSIPSPIVLSIGSLEDTQFMIQQRIAGLNGQLCSPDQKERIWKKLGTYAARYQQIQCIEEQEVASSEYHESWKARLTYNLDQLNEQDSLLYKGVLNKKEQQKAKDALAKLKGLDLKSGLVHGDLSPRNVIWADDAVYLLDWGCAGINVVPHNEIGIVLMSQEANGREFALFLEGMGISPATYRKIEREIHLLNLLHRLDKYRWAEDHTVENITDYQQEVRNTLTMIE